MIIVAADGRRRSVSPFPLDLSNPMPPPMPTKVPESMPSLQPMQADPASNIACIEYISKEAVLDNAALGKAAVVADVISGITPDEDITSKEFTVEAIMREERTTEDTLEGQRTHEEGKSEVTTQALTKDATVEETAVPPVATIAVAINPVVSTPKVHKQNNEVFVAKPYVPDPEEAKGCGFFALPNAPTDFSVICVKQNQVKRYRLLIEVSTINTQHHPKWTKLPYLISRSRRELIIANRKRFRCPPRRRPNSHLIVLPRPTESNAIRADRL